LLLSALLYKLSYWVPVDPVPVEPELVEPPKMDEELEEDELEEPKLPKVLALVPVLAELAVVAEPPLIVLASLSGS
jgi:hypothetical protein